MPVYSLKGYHLTEPVNADGQLSGHAREIEGPQLMAGHQSDWFKQDDKSYTFVCPDGGAVTDTAHYARCELRDEKEYSFKQKITDRLKLKITKLNEGDKVIIHQLHDEKYPWVKMIAEMKSGLMNIRGLVKLKDSDEEVSLPLINGVRLTQELVSEVVWFPQTQDNHSYVRLTVNDTVQRQQAVHTGAHGKVYGKRGAYLQSEKRTGETCIIVHY